MYSRWGWWLWRAAGGVQFSCVLLCFALLWGIFHGHVPLCEAVSCAFFFFSFDFGFSGNRGRFTPAKPWNRPCAPRNELTYSLRDALQNSACPPAQLGLLPTSQNLIKNI